jgi:hypothetical protein
VLEYSKAPATTPTNPNPIPISTTNPNFVPFITEATPSSSPVAIASASPSTSPSPRANWKSFISQVCGVGYSIPPQAEPYTTTSFPAGGASDDNNRVWRSLDLYISDGKLYNLFENGLKIDYFKNTPIGNGYTPGLITLYCAPNSQNMTADTVLENFLKENSTLTLQSSKRVVKWYQQAVVADITGAQSSPLNNEYYFIANPKYIYLITATSESPNDSVKNTTEQIFNSIQFLP